MRLSDGEQQRMEQRLAFRFAAIGDGAQSWLERQLSALSPDCALDDQRPRCMALRLWPLRGRIHVRGQRAARSRDPGPAGLYAALGALRRQSRVGRGVLRRRVALFRRV